MKKLLAILASPRKHGNAAKMLDAAVAQARAQGYETEHIDVYEKNIDCCTGCMACRETGVCVISDDIQGIIRSLTECDLVAVASPTYFANIPGPLKNMFDRLFGAVMDDNSGMIPKPKLSPKQKYLIMVTCTTPFPFDILGRQSTGTVRAIKEVFHYSGLKPAGTVVFAGTRKKKLSDAIIRKIQAKVSACK